MQMNQSNAVSMTLILTFSLREKERDFETSGLRRSSISLGNEEPPFDAGVGRRNFLSLRERGG
jgi:hypothetical protein